MKRVTINGQYAGKVGKENMTIEFICRSEECEELIRTSERGSVKCGEGHINLIKELKDAKD